MNLFLRGPQGIGKSTLIDKVVTSLRQDHELSLGGFVTFKADENVYIADAAIPRGNSKATLVGPPQSSLLTAVFDQYAPTLLKSTQGCDLIILDELGFMEREAAAFQDAVIDCLNAEMPVLAVIKSRHVAWYQRFLEREDVTIFDIDEKNRDDQYYHLLHSLSECM